MKLDAQVDMIEFKDYGDIDLDENPMVTLDCGHFFTAETLDGKYSRGARLIPCPFPSSNNSRKRCIAFPLSELY